MSGAEDLARLTVTIDLANELFLSDEVKMVDVGDGVMRPTNAKVLADLSSQMSGALIYTTVSQGLAGTVSGGYFSVESTNATEYLILYRNSAGSAVEVDRYPNATAITDISKLVQSANSGAAEAEQLMLTDPEGGRLLSLTDKRLTTVGFDVVTSPDYTAILDGDGGVSFYSDVERTIVGPMEVRQTSQPGMFVTDPEGGVLLNMTQQDSDESAAPSPFDDGLLFSSTLATSGLHDSRLYPQSILSRRDLADDVVASVASTSTPTSESGNRIAISASKLGPAATLAVRSKASANTHRIMSLALKDVTIQSPAIARRVLVIGDSICNRQGVFFLKQYLAELGINATFIGTLPTSNSVNNPDDATGDVAEAREGWETGDFTYAITDRVSIIAPGDEAAYLAKSKTDRLPVNPFLRAATGSDPSDIVRNGYVFDPAFYASRFSIAAPDIVVNMLGTNDVRDRTAATIGGHVLSNDTIMHKQIRAAWPAAKIIRGLPGTSFTANRNIVWLSHYRPLILAMKQSAASLALSGMTIAPVWAMTDPENGYAFSAATPGSDGFIEANWSDEVHPIGASRQSLFIALAPFVAAAAINLI